MSRALARIALSLAFAFGAIERADAGESVRLTVSPTLGSQTPRTSGWNSFVAEVNNLTPEPLRLTVSLVPTRFANHPRAAHLAQARSTLDLAAGAVRVVHLQANGGDDGQFTLLATDDDGDVVGQASWSLHAAGVPYLVELPLRPPTSDNAPPRSNPVPGHPFGFTRASAAFVRGRYLLPTHAAEYAAATAVLASPAALDLLPDTEWLALTQWISAGGTLLLTASDTAALRASRASQLVSEVADARPALLLTADMPVAANASNSNHWMFEGPPREGGEALPPLASERLTGFSGDEIRETAFGSVQTYGLGEVHLLGFNPQQAPFKGLPWTEQKLSAAMEAAWLRRRQLVLPLGRQRADDARSYAVVQRIDWLPMPTWLKFALGAGGATYLLGLACSFLFAARRHRYRRVLFAPALAIGSALLTVAAGRSWLGPPDRATRLSLIELGAGKGQGPKTMYRQFTHLASNPPVVTTQLPGSLVSLVAPDTLKTSWLLEPSGDLLVAQPIGANVRAIVVREDGIAQLGNGIHISNVEGELAVTNRSGATLAAVVLRGPDGNVTFFDKIQDRQQVRQSQGRSLRILNAPAAARHFPLLLGSLERHLDAVVPGLSQAWAAIEALRSGEVDWWPPDVPALIACVVGGSGQLTDMELPIRSDRSLVRVVGYGGRP